MSICFSLGWPTQPCSWSSQSISALIPVQDQEVEWFLSKANLNLLWWALNMTVSSRKMQYQIVFKMSWVQHSNLSLYICTLNLLIGFRSHTIATVTNFYSHAERPKKIFVDCVSITWYCEITVWSRTSLYKYNLCLEKSNFGQTKIQCALLRCIQCNSSHNATQSAQHWITFHFS